MQHKNFNIIILFLELISNFKLRLTLSFFFHFSWTLEKFGIWNLCVEFYLGKELSSLSLISTFSPFRIAFFFFFFKRMLKMELSNIAAIVLFFKHCIESESWMGYTLKVVSRTTLVSIVSWRKEMDLITTQDQSC